jgi:hypothetical protein
MQRQATLEDAHNALYQVSQWIGSLQDSNRALLLSLLTNEDVCYLAMLFVDVACGVAQDTELVVALLHSAGMVKRTTERKNEHGEKTH